MRVYIPVSAGDLIDRITILLIKKAKIPDTSMLANVGIELDHLTAIRNCFPNLGTRAIRARERQLHKQNLELWNIENRLRTLETEGKFGKDFVAAARRVYRSNDVRAKLKREINDLAGSALREEKWFSGEFTVADTLKYVESARPSQLCHFDNPQCSANLKAL